MGFKRLVFLDNELLGDRLFVLFTNNDGIFATRPIGGVKNGAAIAKRTTFPNQFSFSGHNAYCCTMNAFGQNQRGTVARRVRL